MFKKSVLATLVSIFISTVVLADMNFNSPIMVLKAKCDEVNPPSSEFSIHLDIWASFLPVGDESRIEFSTKFYVYGEDCYGYGEEPINGKCLVEDSYNRKMDYETSFNTGDLVFEETSEGEIMVTGNDGAETEVDVDLKESIVIKKNLLKTLSKGKKFPLVDQYTYTYSDGRVETDKTDFTCIVEEVIKQ